MATATLAELRARRARECRLTKERALGTVEEAEGFVRERGIVTQTQDSSLPSLFTAMHEPPYAPGKVGFGSWPRTKWRWGVELASRPHVHPVKIHRGKLVLLSGDAALVVDPLCRDALDRAEDGALGDGAAAIVRHLRSSGPSRADDARAALGLDAKAFRAARERLEREGALVSRPAGDTTQAVDPSEMQRHGSTLARWDQSHPHRRKAPLDRALDELVLLGIRAAVVIQEDEPLEWFIWPVPRDTIRRLLGAGRLVRPAAGWVGVA